MAICSRCGEWIDFITQNGRRIPLHPSSRCDGAGEATPRWGRSEHTDSACFKTLCPKGCGADVFFIRHKGGCVWVDPPLGWPWYKHGCLYPDDPNATSRSALGDFVVDDHHLSSPGLILTVAIEIEFSIDWSEWHVISGEADEWRFHTNGDCRFLAGELVFLDLVNHMLVPCFRRDLSFRVIKPRKFSNGAEVTP
jgi:hypothetical protein